MSGNEVINHNALKVLIDAEAVSRVVAVAYADKWSLQIICGEKEKTVIAKNTGKTRVWRKLDTLAKYLLDLGILKFETDVTKYDPSRQTLRRPDSAAALKQAHMSHKRMIKEQQGLKSEGDSIVGNLSSIKKEREVSPNEVRESWEKRRARILQEANPRVK